MSISIVWLECLDSDRPVVDCVPVRLDERYIRLVKETITSVVGFYRSPLLRNNSVKRARLSTTVTRGTVDAGFNLVEAGWRPSPHPHFRYETERNAPAFVGWGVYL